MNLRELKHHRRELRKNMTLAEKQLWELLRGRNLEEIKFRRQVSVNNYILDFYAPSIRLAIEVDGSVHETEGAPERDSVRQRDVGAHGIEFLRFSNDDVLRDAQRVIERIRAKIREKRRLGGY